MKIPSKSSSRVVNQDKAEEREEWHKLVVKIISWKDGLLEGGSVKASDKITAKEWAAYSKKKLQTNISYGREKVLETLEETKKSIQKHNGFSK